jgi:hypothetical protein
MNLRFTRLLRDAKPLASGNSMRGAFVSACLIAGLFFVAAWTASNAFAPDSQSQASLVNQMSSQQSPPASQTAQSPQPSATPQHPHLASAVKAAGRMGQGSSDGTVLQAIRAALNSRG